MEMVGPAITRYYDGEGNADTALDYEITDTGYGGIHVSQKYLGASPDYAWGRNFAMYESPPITTQEAPLDTIGLGLDRSLDFAGLGVFG